jgi:histone acetyltransferase SAS3
MTENDELGCHFVGYFSKEKRPSSMNNVSCILVLPIYQRRGFGQMLIDFSYQLTRREEKTGSPEKPLSDMGLVSYRQYWRLMMCYELLEQKEQLSVTDLTKRTGMTPDDVVSALEGLRALVRDPITKNYALRLDFDYYKEYIEKYESKGYPKINPNSLVWVPYVMNRGLSQHYEGTGPINTVAPREDDDEEEDEVEEGIEEEERDKAKAIEAVIETQKAITNGEHTNLNGNGTNGVSPDESDPTTPQGNNDQAHQLLLLASGGGLGPNAEIPAIRYEIWPPIPGLGRKRGRPPGSTKKKSGHTPRSHSQTMISAFTANGMGGNGLGITSSALPNGSPVLRRTRSALADTTTTGSLEDGEGEDDDDTSTGDKMDIDEVPASINVPLPDTGDDADSQEEEDDDDEEEEEEDEEEEEEDEEEEDDDDEEAEVEDDDDEADAEGEEESA